MADEKLTAAQMRQALYRHYAARCAVLFEVSTDAQPENISVPGEPPIRLHRRRQIDVLTVSNARKTGIGPLDLLAIEIKVSRGDFLSDIKNPAKQARWREVAHRHAYAVPDGLVRPDEVPDESGLLTVAPSTYEGAYRWDVNWARRARYAGARLSTPPWLTLGLAYRMSAAEAKLRGYSHETQGADESAEDLRGQLLKARADLKLANKKAERASNEATEWKIAFAATGGELPCRHCRKPVVPRTFKGGHFSTWRHRDSADNAACEAIRPSRWTTVEPPDELDAAS